MAMKIQKIHEYLANLTLEDKDVGEHIHESHELTSVLVSKMVTEL